MRHYLPAAPLTLAATAAALVNSWRAGGDRRAILTAAAGTVSATAITGYLVRNVNQRLLQSPEPLRASESRRLVSRWHRGNLLRLLALAIAALALRRAAPTSHR